MRVACQWRRADAHRDSSVGERLRDLVVLNLAVLVIVTGFVFGAIGFGIGFAALVSIPYFRSSAREREINVLLSDSISFMYALSVGGLNQLEILQSMGRAEDTYGEVSREFQSIVQETEYFGTDYRNAIRQQALLTPSDELSQFLTDMLSIVNSGGDMQGFLDDKKDKHLRTAKQQQEQTLETMELFGEMYMTLSLFPLLLIIILVIMSMLGEAQSRLLYATVYGLIPLTGVGFLVLVSTVKQDEIGDGSLRSAPTRRTVAMRASACPPRAHRELHGDLRVSTGHEPRRTQRLLNSHGRSGLWLVAMLVWAWCCG